MPRLKRTITAKRLAVNHSAALKSTGPHTGKRRPSLNTLLGFGLAFAHADYKGLFGFGDSVRDLTSPLFYANCEERLLWSECEKFSKKRPNKKIIF